MMGIALVQYKWTDGDNYLPTLFVYDQFDIYQFTINPDDSHNHIYVHVMYYSTVQLKPIQTVGNEADNLLYLISGSLQKLCSSSTCNGIYLLCVVLTMPCLHQTLLHCASSSSLTLPGKRFEPVKVDVMLCDHTLDWLPTDVMPATDRNKRHPNLLQLQCGEHLPK